MLYFERVALKHKGKGGETMHKLIRLMVVLAMVALFMVIAVPALADGDDNGGPPDKTTIVAPSVGGPDNTSVKAPVAMVPDKSTHPVFDANPAYGGLYPSDPNEAGAPGTVFWQGDSVLVH
jgi:hypothetical protein